MISVRILNYSQNLSGLTYTYLYSPSTFSPRMFYLCWGWLRCVLGFERLRLWCVGVRLLLYYILYYYILTYTLLLFLSDLLFLLFSSLQVFLLSSSQSSPNPLPSPHSFYTCRYLFMFIYIPSILLSQIFSPRMFIGWGWLSGCVICLGIMLVWGVWCVFVWESCCVCWLLCFVGVWR